MSKYLMAVKGFGESAPITLSAEETDALNNGESVIKFTVEVIDLVNPTRNNIIYPIEEMQKAITRDRITQQLKTGVFLGEDEHPDNPDDINRWTHVDRDNSHHKFTKLWNEGSKLYGEVQTIPGQDKLLNAIKGGELPSFSIRVLGAPEEYNGYIRLTDIHLIAIDWVKYPGNPTSFVDDSRHFNITNAPLKDGFDINRQISRGECAKFINLGENQSIIPLGNGNFKIIENISKSEYSTILSKRKNSF